MLDLAMVFYQPEKLAQTAKPTVELGFWCVKMSCVYETQLSSSKSMTYHVRRFSLPQLQPWYWDSLVEKTLRRDLG